MNNLHVGQSLAGGMEQSASGGQRSLAECVEMAIEAYFSDLEGHPPAELFNMVMREVERPLLATVMKQVHGNQTRAAKMLGINRSTLRKKLAHYGLNR